MKIVPIMDAGPGLNFFSLNKERMSFEVSGPIAFQKRSFLIVIFVRSQAPMVRAAVSNR